MVVQRGFDDAMVKLVYFDIASQTPVIKEFSFDNLSTDDIKAKYFFQEGSLGNDKAQSFMMMLKSGEYIEINLTTEKVIRKQLSLVKQIDNCIRLKTDRLAERCVIYSSNNKYIGHYVKFRGWKILPFPIDIETPAASKNMSLSKSMMGGMLQGASRFKMAPMLHQKSDPLTRMNSSVSESIKDEHILSVFSLEHLGFICQVSEVSDDPGRWNIKMIECSRGRIMKQFTIDCKNVVLNSIRITHERNLRFCGFCGFLSCKKIHLHYLVKHKQHAQTSDYHLVVVDLINNRVKNVKKQRICFRVERDSREVRCYGLNHSFEFKKVYKLKHAVEEPVYNSYTDEYCYLENKTDSGRSMKQTKFVKINLAKLDKPVHLPIDACKSIPHLTTFENFSYTIPKPSTDEEIRKTDLQELENDSKEIDKSVLAAGSKLKYLFNSADDTISYYC